VQNYSLSVGMSQGANDLVQSADLPAGQTAYSVPALPTGVTLWARILTLGSDSVWRQVDVSFTAAPRQATFTYPLNGATNVDTTQPFSWGGASGPVGNYRLFIGTTQGAGDLVTSPFLRGNQTSYDVGALPTGQTLWARIRTKGFDGVWRTSDISFTAG
jgi:hypothetical protein